MPKTLYNGAVSATVPGNVSAASVTIGNVTTTSAGTSPTATNVGTARDHVLNLEIPKGRTGAPSAIVGNVAFGDLPSLQNVGTADDLVLDFIVPKTHFPQGDVLSSNLAGHLSSAPGNLAVAKGLRESVGSQLAAKQPRVTGSSKGLLGTFASNGTVVTLANGDFAVAPFSNMAYFAGVTDDLKEAVQGLQPKITGTLRNDPVLSADATVVVNEDGLLTTGVGVPKLRSIANLTQDLQMSLDGSQDALPQHLWNLRNVLAANALVVTDALGNVTALGNAQKVAYLDTQQDLQALLDDAQPKVTGSLGSLIRANVAPEQIVVTLANGFVGSSGIPSAKAQHLANLRSPVGYQVSSKQPLVTGPLARLATSNATPDVVMVTLANGDVWESSVPSANLPAFAGVPDFLDSQRAANVSDYLTRMQLAVTGTLASVATANLAAGRILISNGGNLETSVPSSKLAYIRGLSADLQGSLDGLQPRVTGAGANVMYTSGPDVVMITDSSGNIAYSTVPTANVQYLGNLDTSSADLQLSLANLQPRISTGALTRILRSNLATERVAVSRPYDGKVSVATTPAAKLAFLTNVTQDIQTSIDGLQPAITGALKSVTQSLLNPGKVMVTLANGTLGTSSVPSQVIGYLDDAPANVAQAVANLEPVVTGGLRTVLQGILQSGNVVKSLANGALGVTNFPSANLVYFENIRSNVQMSAYQNAVYGGLRTVLTANLDSSKIVVTDAEGALTTANVSSNVLAFLGNLVEPVQSTLDAKENVVTGAARSVLYANLTANNVAVSLPDGTLGSSGVDSAKLRYVANLRSSVANQVASKSDVFTGSLRSIESLLPNGIVVTLADGSLGTSTALNPSNLDYLQNVSTDVVATLATLEHAVVGSGRSIAYDTLSANLVVATDDQGNVSTIQYPAANLEYLKNVSSDVNGSLANLQNTVTGSLRTAVTSNFAPNVVVETESDGTLVGTAYPASNLGYLQNVTTDVASTLAGSQDVVTGGISSITYSTLAAGKVVVTDAQGKVAASTVDAANAAYAANVNTSLAFSLSSKQPGFRSNTANSLIGSAFAGSRVLVTDAYGQVLANATTAGDIANIQGLIANVQLQLDAKQPLFTSTDLVVNSLTATTFGGVSPADGLTYFGDGSDGDLYSGFGTITLTRDTYYGNVTFGGTDSIVPSGYRLFVSGTLDLTNASAECINRNGTNAGSASNPQLAPGTLGGAPLSQAGATANTDGRGGSNVTFGLGGNGGDGGNGTGITGVVGGTIGGSGGIVIQRMELDRPVVEQVSAIQGLIAGGASGASGGGGYAAGSRGAPTGAAVVWVGARRIRAGNSGTSYIAARGGAGGNGTTFSGAGGGGGGGGGYVVVIYGTFSGSATVNAKGGDAGAGQGGGIGGQGGEGGRVSLFNFSKGLGVTVIGATTTKPTSGEAGTPGGACLATFV